MLVFLPTDSSAQLELLLRITEPSEPRPGLCGLYRFDATEPDGNREATFRACIVAASNERVVLELSSGDTLQVRIDVDPALFESPGAPLSDHILAVERNDRGKVRRLQADDWRQLPALAPAPRLPVVADSSLGTRQLDVRGAGTVAVRGRHLEEARTEVREVGGVSLTQSEHRVLDLWSAPRAPILGVVTADATVRSERVFERPIAGVPQRGPRVSRYRLQLIAILSDPEVDAER